MTAPFPVFLDRSAVYKYCKVTGSSDRMQHWTGYVVDESALAVLWCDNTVSHYGSAAEDPDPARYTTESLAHDRVAGKLLVDAIRRLRNGQVFAIKEGAAKTATEQAIIAMIFSSNYNAWDKSDTPLNSTHFIAVNAPTKGGHRDEQAKSTARTRHRRQHNAQRNQTYRRDSPPVPIGQRERAHIGC